MNIFGSRFTRHLHRPFHPLLQQWPVPNQGNPSPSRSNTLKLRTHVVKLISSANTGYFYTLVRPRTAAPKRMMKFDPKGTSCASCSSMEYIFFEDIELIASQCEGVV